MHQWVILPAALLWQMRVVCLTRCLTQVLYPACLRAETLSAKHLVGGKTDIPSSSSTVQPVGSLVDGVKKRCWKLQYPGVSAEAVACKAPAAKGHTALMQQRMHAAAHERACLTLNDWSAKQVCRGCQAAPQPPLQCCITCVIPVSWGMLITCDRVASVPHSCAPGLRRSSRACGATRAAVRRRPDQAGGEGHPPHQLRVPVPAGAVRAPLPPASSCVRQLNVYMQCRTLQLAGGGWARTAPARMGSNG